MKRLRFCCAALVALALAAVSALAATGGGGEALMMDKCKACHGTEVICSLLGKRDKDGWDWIVNEMQRNGAKVNVDQKRQIVDYLAALPAGSAPVCPAPEKAEPAAAAGTDGAALVAHYCTLCHDTRRICKNLRVKGKDAWDKTVTMMMFKGAPFDVAQKQIIVDYLYSLPAGSKPVCP